MYKIVPISQTPGLMYTMDMISDTPWANAHTGYSPFYTRYNKVVSNLGEQYKKWCNRIYDNFSPSIRTYCFAQVVSQGTLLPPTTKLRQGNVYCLSIILFTGGWCLPLVWGGVTATHSLGRHPPGQTLPGRHPAGQTEMCMLGYTTSAQCMMGYTPPAQCILGCGQQVSSTHPTGMHSCQKSNQ